MSLQEQNVACMKQGFSVFMQRLRVLKGKFLVTVCTTGKSTMEIDV